MTPRCGDLATVLRCSYSFSYSCSGLQVQFQVQFSCALGGAGGENSKTHKVKYLTPEYDVSTCCACSLERSSFHFLSLGIDANIVRQSRKAVVNDNAKEVSKSDGNCSQKKPVTSLLGALGGLGLSLGCLWMPWALDRFLEDFGFIPGFSWSPKSTKFGVEDVFWRVPWQP